MTTGYSTFEDWFAEQEGFSVRAERFDGDVAWLKAAFEAGRAKPAVLAVAKAAARADHDRLADKPKLVSGMKLWWVPSRLHSQPSEITVEKAGRTWAQLSNRHRADIKTWVVDGYGYSPAGTIWPSREAHESWAARDSSWRDFRNDVGNIRLAPEHISIEEINQMRRLIGLEVRESSNG